ncbi:serpin-Z1-like [Lolium perenne]|uniref:serpin-Z1-like n=1 Tax=Lolium perenne TaxID=4522 RepID=UPI003A9998FE
MELTKEKGQATLCSSLSPVSSPPLPIEWSAAHSPPLLSPNHVRPPFPFVPIVGRRLTRPCSSPLSIHAALALLGAGAKGDTLDQIVAFLGPAGGRAHAALALHVALPVLSDNAGDDGEPTVRFANGVWVDDAMRLKAGYTAVVSEHYRSQTRPASFKAMVSPSPPLSIVAAFSQEFAPMLDSNLSQLICFMPEEARAEINQRFESVTAGSRSSCPKAPSTATWWLSSGMRSTSRAPGAASSTFYMHAFGHHVRAPFMSSGKRQPAVPATRCSGSRTRSVDATARADGDSPCTSTSRTSAMACRPYCRC